VMNGYQLGGKKQQQAQKIGTYYDLRYGMFQCLLSLTKSYGNNNNFLTLNVFLHDLAAQLLQEALQHLTTRA
ncbi:hypothetical protein ACJX0J_034068, partial [Zea mays]